MSDEVVSSHIQRPSYLLSDILRTPYFVANLIISVTITLSINCVIDYFTRNKDNPKILETHPAVSLMLLLVIMSSISCVTVCGIHRRISAGSEPIIAQSALRANTFTRFFLFSMAEPRWQWRIPKFAIQSLFFPGAPLYFLLFIICVAAGNGTGLLQCPVPSAVQLGILEGCKFLSVMIIFTCNYLAAHNAEQPWLISAIEVEKNALIIDDDSKTSSMLPDEQKYVDEC